MKLMQNRDVQKKLLNYYFANQLYRPEHQPKQRRPEDLIDLLKPADAS